MLSDLGQTLQPRQILRGCVRRFVILSQGGRTNKQIHKHIAL